MVASVVVREIDTEFANSAFRDIYFLVLLVSQNCDTKCDNPVGVVPRAMEGGGGEVEKSTPYA